MSARSLVQDSGAPAWLRAAARDSRRSQLSHNGRVSVAQLPFGLTYEALAAAMSEEDPESLAAASRMRARYGAELSAAALTQATLRRQAKASLALLRPRCSSQSRFGAGRDQKSLTCMRAGSSKPGFSRVIDLGCGVGSDSLAFARAGLEVVSVDVDPITVRSRR